MQQLVADMNTLEQVIEPICNKLLVWEKQDIYTKIQNVVKPVTDMVTLILNNKELFDSLGIELEEDKVFHSLGTVTKALEQTDDILLLDGLYSEFLPWLRTRKIAMIEVLNNS